jgi:N-acetylglutamate synthase-like GNAT family acetyltransferase
MPTMLVNDGDSVVGFLTIKMHFPKSADVHCVGILPMYHRTSIERLLMSIEHYAHIYAYCVLTYIYSYKLLFA